MTAKGASSLFGSTLGNPQGTLSLDVDPNSSTNPTYVPSPKHDPVYGWGSENPIKSQADGQNLLDTGYSNGKQVFNVADDGTIVKLQPDGTPQNGYHAYSISSPSEIPTSILRQMLSDRIITKHRYSQIINGDL